MLQPMPSFALPTMHTGVLSRLDPETVRTICSRHSKEVYEQQNYREAVVVPLFVNQAASILDYEKVHAHIEHPRQHCRPPDIMRELMAHSGGEREGTSSGPQSARREAQSLGGRRGVTGKIGERRQASTDAWRGRLAHRPPREGQTERRAMPRGDARRDRSAHGSPAAGGHEPLDRAEQWQGRRSTSGRRTHGLDSLQRRTPRSAWDPGSEPPAAGRPSQSPLHW